MKAIQIKFLPATDKKGVRLKAYTEAGSLTEGRDYSVEPKDQAFSLAVSYLLKFDWEKHASIIGFGCLPGGNYVATLGDKKCQ
jgi:hypothetical protein